MESSTDQLPIPNRQLPILRFTRLWKLGVGSWEFLPNVHCRIETDADDRALREVHVFPLGCRNRAARADHSAKDRALHSAKDPADDRARAAADARGTSLLTDATALVHLRRHRANRIGAATNSHLME